jgi:protocatechuate 3,4-dioxygenase beta subunit
MNTKRTTRREAIGAAGLFGGAVLSGAVPALARGLLSPAGAEAATSLCVLETPDLTEGPYWVDAAPNRSDIVANSSSATSNGGVAQQGVPLKLTIRVLDDANGCSPWVGAQVDVWHANAKGVYSDERSEGTSGEDFLRGYQLTDSEGAVTFETIYPGWYSGRAVHIHVRVRSAEGATKALNWTTQIFFSDTQNDAVFERASGYTARGLPDTTDETDQVFTSEGKPSTNAETSVITLSGDNSEGYSGVFDVALDASGAGTGTSSTGGSGSSGSGSGGGETTSGSTASKLPELLSAHVQRDGDGARTLVLRMHATRRTHLAARLGRGQRTIAARSLTIAVGTHRLRIPIASSVAAGGATLALHETAGTTTATTHVHVHVPRS